MKETTTTRYSLFTAITMIVGIAIGSGIFFKADNVLKATNGSIFYGVLLFILGAIAIIFGGLCIAELAARTKEPGGVIAYSEAFVSRSYGSAFGWFHTLVYYPTLSAVVAYVVGIYACTLFGWEISTTRCSLIGFLFITLCFLYNILLPRFGGFFQDFSCIVKMIPLVVLAFCGIFWGDPLSGFTHLAEQTQNAGKWIMGISAVAFAYDGWIVSTAIAHEIKDAQKNLPLALIIAPLLILFLYLAYFIAIATYLGPETVITQGDHAVYEMAASFFPGGVAKIVLICIIISVMGTVNGIILGGIRLPYSLALKNATLPHAQWFAKENEQFKMPVHSGLFLYLVTVFWSVIHYFTTSYHILGSSDISEIAICFSYILYLAFYWKVFALWRTGEIKSCFRGVICPILAAAGVIIILFGGLIGGGIYLLYLAFSALVFFTGIIHDKRARSHKEKAA